jgi:N-acetylneuraminate synthase
MLLVAEIGASHNRKLENALRLIRETPEAHAFKIQTWYGDSMSVPYTLTSGPWKGYDLAKLYERARTPWEWHQEIFDSCRVRNVIPFSTPFDRQSVDFLERLDCPMYKIASFELVDLQLIDYVAQTGKPMIMSCGQADTHEIRAAVNTARKYCDDITLLHCVSQYPTETSEVNLKTMNALSRFGCKVGLSDHSKGDLVPIAAATMGAKVIEKHISIHQQGLDGKFSMKPYQFNNMARKVKRVDEVMGEVKFGGDFELRRSLYFTANLPAGTQIKPMHIKTARPNLGLSPVKIEKFQCC